jgi:hypothetical protein
VVLAHARRTAAGSKAAEMPVNLIAAPRSFRQGGLAKSPDPSLQKIDC